MGFFIGDFLGVVAPSAGKISGFSLFVFLQVFNLLPDFFSYTNSICLSVLYNAFDKACICASIPQFIRCKRGYCSI